MVQQTIPQWCNGKCSYCTQWYQENPHIQVCRGCPYLKEEWYSRAIGRFGYVEKKKE